MFAVGDLVVCIDDRFHPVAYEWCLQLPRKGEVYTVRTVSTMARCYVTGIAGLGIRLVELTNPIQTSPWNAEPSFTATRFKALGISEHARTQERVAVGAPN